MTSINNSYHVCAIYAIYHNDIVLKPEQVVDKEFLGHICTATMMNELEIIAWCYTIYLMLHYELISAEIP